MSRSKKLLGFGMLCAVISAQAMQPEQPSCAIQQEGSELSQPENDQYARIFSEQNRRYLARVGYSEQDIELLIASERFQEQERIKPLLQFCQEEKKISQSNLVARDAELRAKLRGIQVFKRAFGGDAQQVYARLEAEKRRDKCWCPILTTSFLTSFGLFWWFFVEYNNCRPVRN